MMFPVLPENADVISEFNRWWKQNQRRSLALIWRRRFVWWAQVLQRLGFHVETSVPLFFGDRMRVVTGETISSALLAFGYSEVAVTMLMLSLLSEGDTMVDVGTHFGYEALLGSHLVGSTGKVIGFEPSPQTFAIARKNLGHLKQVSLHNLAIADSIGRARLQDRNIAQGALNRLLEAGAEQDSVEVPVTTLDAALAGRERPVKFLKCDAEGSELAVLKGAHDILVRDSPVMVLEADMPINGEPSTRACELVRYLADYDYKALSFDFDQGLKVGPFGSFPTYHANVAFVPSAHVENL